MICVSWWAVLVVLVVLVVRVVRVVLAVLVLVLVLVVVLVPARYKLTCVGYGHEHCSKRRSVSADHCLRFGEVEAAAYCLAWYKLGVSTGSKSEHLALRPTAADVERAVLELQGS